MMLGITMTEASGRETHTIIIDYETTEHDFVTSVPVNIGNAIVMVALSVPWRAFLIVHPTPTLRELVGVLVNIKGNELMTGIDTTSYEDAWITSVKVWCAVEELA